MESGLQTFRDSDGLWMGYNVYDVASPQGWKRDPKMVLDFYNMRRKDVAAAKPNAALDEFHPEYLSDNRNAVR